MLCGITVYSGTVLLGTRNVIWMYIVVQ